ncbi:connector enhancer of kinase suppressor of ras 1 [Pelobates cultripes]|uniref:Connector enhancer of kinase suppressor of ras 1 n=2 Tax=Pelobates cultripes TaxID=61616 RepID=A0AAD1VJP0_PELCU|nr:connector enhancer of kinase suppressor of ras 1 [Pelobates cultripes]
MEPVTTWTPETVCSYLRGLHSSVQHYPFQEWDVTGHDLLALSPQRLDALGVRSIGHQELILEAVEQLCALHYELHSENLRSLTDKLFRVSQSLCTHILSLRKVSLHSSTNAISPTQKQLVCIVDIVSAARGLFSWLNRHLFTRLNDYSASREIIALCIALSENLQEDWSDAEIENKILTICQSICGICKSILNCSPTILLNQTATLELVHISPEQPDSKLGINIKSTSSGLHFVCGTELESPAGRCDRILPGDEIIKVNEQTVVGWTRQNLVWKLLEKTDCVSLVLKKVSVASTPQTPTDPTLPKRQVTSSPLQDHTGHTLPNISGSASVPTKQRTLSLQIKRIASSSPRVKSEPSTPTDCAVTNLIVACSAPTTPTKNICLTNEILLGSSQVTPHTSGTNLISHSQIKSSNHAQPIIAYPPNQSTSQNLPVDSLSSVEEVNFGTTQFTTRQRSGSENSQTETILLTPQSSVNLRHTLSDSNLFKSTHPSSPLHTELQSGEDSTERVVEKRDSVDNNKNTEKNKQPSVKRKQAQQTKPKSSVPLRNQKGTTTKLSRRRVSCRDLGLPDCDGYLWKKKENVGFMSQRWKHCWCVLKGSRLFWYNSPQDEKALGLVNVSTYKLESTLDSKHKKKYEFQLCHATYKPFVFAADNLDDMNKWVTCLVKTLHKYKLPSNASHPPEEECYSETEAEQDDDQPRTQEMSRKQIVQSPVKNLKVTKTSVSQAESMAAGASPALKGDESQYEGDDLKIMISCLQQGGVSLIGTKTTMTREEYRKSFIRRSKNPDINHKAHTLRVLQSTLKAKLSELDTLNQILDNPDISSEAFRQWKLKNEQLYETIGRGTRARESLGDFLGNLEAERSQKKSESEPSD